jgi:hypothetical protein
MNPQRLALVLGSGPLVETVSGYDTSALLEGLAERRSLLDVSALALMHWLARSLSLAQRLTKPQLARCTFRRSNSEVTMKC